MFSDLTKISKTSLLRQPLSKNKPLLSPIDQTQKVHQDFEHLIKAFACQSQKGIKQLSGLTKLLSHNNYQVEARNQFILIQPPSPQAHEELSQIDLKIWISDLFKKVISVAFRQCYNNQMNFQQAKIFCSENILKNLAVLSEKNQLTPRHFQIIDNHLQLDVFEYLMKHYPLAESQQVNRMLQNSLKRIDNVQDLTNNYFFDTQILFQYRSSGNYNDLIMRVINDLIIRLSAPSKEQPTMNNFNFYKNFMEKLFEKVYDEDWMNDRCQVGQKITGDKQRAVQKQKYADNVKEYTHFRLGKKIPDNVRSYTNKQIKNGYLDIKSSTILRILTKWCAELLRKYQTLNYFKTKVTNIKLIKGKRINNLQLFMKQYLDDQIEKEGKQVEEFMKNIYENNYQMQSALFELQLSDQGDYHIDRIQKICGKFSNKIVNNLHTYIVIYLNRLIHGLMKISANFHTSHNLSKSAWPYPPNLLSLTVSDIMRCRFVSKQRQVVKIYQQIEILSKQYPNKFKLVRVKNRLGKGTNDVLLNVKFFNILLCQIQLSVKENQSSFSSLSSKFCHFIYQLQRSHFGPITELCSIWQSLDRRSQSYSQAIKSQKKRIWKKIDPRIKLNLKPFHYPFICSECGSAYSHTHYFKNHEKDTEHKYWICAICKIESLTEKQLIEDMIEDEQLKKHIKQRYKDCNTKIPDFGVAVFMRSKSIKLQIFRIYECHKIKYILSVERNNIYCLGELRNNKDIQIFLKKYLVFSISNPDNKFINLTDQMARKHYILPKQIKSSYEKEKQTISIINENLIDQDLELILGGDYKYKGFVKNMFLTGNKLTNFEYVCDNFPQLQWLELNNNHSLQSYSKLEKLPLLHMFILDQCPLKTLNPEILTLKKLRTITISQSQIETLPEDIDKWQSIQHIQIDFNCLKGLPQSFCKLNTLRMLNLNGNKISELPKKFSDLDHLQQLFLAMNDFKIIPEQVYDLKNLIKMDFHKNSIKQIDSKLGKLKNLQILNLSQNQMNGINKFQFKELTKLKTLSLNQCKLTKIPNLYQCKFLEDFQASSNQITEISHESFADTPIEILNLNQNQIENGSQLQKIKTLKNVFLNKNKLKNLQGILGKLPQLQILQANSNQIEELPKSGTGCKKLTNLSLNDNKIKHIPVILSKCTSLAEIHFKNNEIQQIPIEFIFAHNLELIQVTGNKLKMLPIQFKKTSILINGIIGSNCQ